jgi:hypothetical protein
MEGGALAKHQKDKPTQLGTFGTESDIPKGGQNDWFQDHE